MASSQEQEFEITKFYAGILSTEFRWISCHTRSDGRGVSYRSHKDRADTMSGEQVRYLGHKIEQRRSIHGK